MIPATATPYVNFGLVGASVLSLISAAITYFFFPSSVLLLIILLGISLLCHCSAPLLTLNLSHAYKEVSLLAITDPLTGAVNRRRFFEILSEEKARVLRNSCHELSLIIFDLDSFKSINDSQGHYTGDQVLAALGSILPKELRKYDTLARIGGEEFAVLLPESSLNDAMEIAERLRNKTESLSVKAYKVSASFGVGIWDRHETTSEFYNRIDLAAYAAKEAGKNQIHLAK